MTYKFELRVETPIFNCENKAELAKIALNERRYQTETIRTRQSVMVGVRKAFQNIITQRESMDAARVARELSEEQLAGRIRFRTEGAEESPGW